MADDRTPNAKHSDATSPRGSDPSVWIQRLGNIEQAIVEKIITPQVATEMMGEIRADISVVRVITEAIVDQPTRERTLAHLDRSIEDVYSLAESHQISLAQMARQAVRSRPSPDIT